ncbi:LPXTG cell wall anchor domain-containing protein [Microbacterium invictum]|uniref:LPXTG cell wall anchor domain-containing protein n=1 Tax=Microbacterium invictum TaxID=515415 RepID=A0ABZ0VCE4_9MICO|nr:LPXTG cell wall anchor domain-containing protein [Microbacterium invictum]WQB70804.1 LPXTG cell wall anchor domain-containing protein [Microbacterium invictum]
MIAATNAGDVAPGEGGVDVLVDIAPAETPSPTPTPTVTSTPSVTPTPGVTAAPGSGGSVPDGLGATGVDPTAAIVLGAALLLSGVAALLARRRRRISAR